MVIAEKTNTASKLTKEQTSEVMKSAFIARSWLMTRATKAFDCILSDGHVLYCAWLDLMVVTLCSSISPLFRDARAQSRCDTGRRAAPSPCSLRQ